MTPDRDAGPPVTPGELDALLRARVVEVPDWPKPGVGFKDITPLLADARAFAAAVDAVVERHGQGSVDKVAGIEARGFLLGAPVAYHLGAGFVPVRKAGKLPRGTREVRYDLEYGSAVLEVHHDAFAAGDQVLVVDDVLATGGTAAATTRLVAAAGAVPVGLSVLLELTVLGGREVVNAGSPGLDVHALLTY